VREVTANDADWAEQEGRRQEAAERDWLGSSTEGRPSFAEAEVLDRQGIPSCHVWEIPPGELPSHLTATGALRRWQAGACAMCSATRSRLLVDHDHGTGLIRGLLCASCNTAEGLQSAPVFIAYRERPPAVMLGVTEQYGSAWDGFGASVDRQVRDERNAAHVDAAGALFAGMVDRFRPTPPR